MVANSLNFFYYFQKLFMEIIFNFIYFLNNALVRKIINKIDFLLKI